MRARNIKPSFYTNADLAECSIEARLLAPALWMMADREGRLIDRPKQIKGECFPYDNLDIDAMLNELFKWGHIIRYEVDGAKYIQIVNFEKHQRPHPNEKHSFIPKVKSAFNQGAKHFALNDDIMNDDIMNDERGMLAFAPTLTLIDNNWLLPEEWGKWAEQETGLGKKAIITEARKFHNNAISKAIKSADWFAEWKKWIYRTKEFSK